MTANVNVSLSRAPAFGGRRSTEEHTFVTVKVSEVLEQLVSVAHQDLNYGPGLVWVGYKHLQQHMSLFARWSQYVCLLLRVTHAGQHAKTSAKQVAQPWVISKAGTQQWFWVLCFDANQPTYTNMHSR